MSADGIAARSEAEVRHAPDGDDDEAGRRALDCQLGITEDRANDPADNRGEDPRNRRVPAS